MKKKLRRSNLPGHPDFVYPRARLAVFLHGCWWHGCPEHYVAPRTHATFWRKKLLRNQERDKLVREELESLGWRILEVWEHEMKENPTAVAKRIKAIAAKGPDSGAFPGT